MEKYKKKFLVCHKKKKTVLCSLLKNCSNLLTTTEFTFLGMIL
jgi:hypothetical protein